MTRENVIAVARLGGDNLASNSTPAETLRHLLRIKVRNLFLKNHILYIFLD